MIVAGFPSKQALLGAAGAMRQGGFGAVQTYTPAKLSDEGPDSVVSPIPLIMFAAGVLGAGFFFWLQVHATVTAYPIDVGGRPNNSWPAYVTNAFEVGVLSAMAVGFLAYLVANRMPHLYDPVDECEGLRRASRDAWFLSVTPRDARDGIRARDVLIGFGPIVLQAVPE